MSVRVSSRGLRGRRAECAEMDGLLADLRSGRSRVLVVRGEPGIGKTALLDHLLRDPAGCHVARVVGVESEMELAFAGLHQLCASLIDREQRLPGPQRDALETAFGSRAGSPPNRFMVGLAVLSLLALAGDERPLICVVDDAQWLDQVSAQTLVFVARRLMAERVAMVFAARAPHDGGADEFRGLPELTLQGLPAEDSVALLDSAVPGRLDDRVRDRIISEARGNPLALLELPRTSSATELAGGFVVPGSRPPTGHIEQSFLQRIASLPPETRRFLLAAAAEPLGDVPLLFRAAAQLGVGGDAAALAEAAGLVDLGARVRFRHPLVRSVLYRTARQDERRLVHGVLADATDPDVDPDRRAWHRAHATVEADEEVAGDLERSAHRARARGGVAAAAEFLMRATELTPHRDLRGARALAAALAKVEAGELGDAEELLATAHLSQLDQVQQARLVLLRARIVFARTRGSAAPPLLLDAATQLDRLDTSLARETYLEALGAAIFAGRLGAVDGIRRAAEAARAAPARGDPARPVDLLLDGVTTRFTDGYAAGHLALRRALLALREDGGRPEDLIARWLWVSCPVLPEPIASELWDDSTWHELATRAVSQARETGALAVLPVALGYRAGVHVHAGEFAAAAALIEEADAIASASGNPPLPYTSVVLVAWQGDEVRAARRIDAATRDATSRGEGRALGLLGHATAVLYNGLGRYEAALAGARWACEHEDLGLFGGSLVELVEAAVRAGAPDEASAAFDRLSEMTRASGTDWALGVRARSHALLSEGAIAEALYREAIERLGRCRIVVHLARAHLVYGEWLRRERRRSDAREHLRTAHGMFARFGAEAFADRARRELSATGHPVPQDLSETSTALTLQEAQIARLARDGLTNPEIGAQLFISPRTVEWHLRKVFTKLGLSTRKELRRALSDDATGHGGDP